MLLVCSMRTGWPGLNNELYCRHKIQSWYRSPSHGYSLRRPRVKDLDTKGELTDVMQGEDATRPKALSLEVSGDRGNPIP